jgi:hypothetical protein
VGNGWYREPLDVIWRDKVLALNQRQRLSAFHQGDASAGAGAHGNARRASGRNHKIDNVALQLVGDANIACGLAYLADIVE